MTSAIVHGPRRVGPRRLVSVPRSLLRGARIAVPGDVRICEVDGVVIVQAASGAEATGRVSKVGQVVAPRWVMERLQLDVGDGVYARAVDGGVELLGASRVRVRRVP